MYGKELGIEEFNIQLVKIILFLNLNLKPNTSTMFWIAPIYKR